MDELLHHCLRELALDGDLGSNVSRLKDFVDGFYSHNAQQQNIDDAFCAFVWSMVVQQPNVQVGAVPTGITSEVYIAPQVSAKRKAKARGEEPVETSPPKLDIIPDAKQRSLEDLKMEYGDNLRIALDPNAIYTAITGSHIRFAKLSPMVYSALQLITRGRDNGLSVVALGQQSGYDQKTCFYLVRQLTELGLVAKVRRGGIGTHFCIHKYFFERSPFWQAIRDEELRADERQSVQAAEANDVEDDNTTMTQPLDFTPIDARHLSSLPLVRARVIKLLKASKSHIHAAQNMVVTIGFANPTKTDRRFFQSRIREMIQQGLVERVIVPSHKKSSSAIKCLRLVAPDGSPDAAGDDGIVVQQELGDDAEQEEVANEQDRVKMNLTIHKQIVDLLEESGTKGMTLTDLSTVLCQFDRRTIELLLTRAEKYPPPPHLSDLGIVALMETSGRERRHRYFTVAGYRDLVVKEKLDNEHAVLAQVDFTASGEFMPIEQCLLYGNEADLMRHQDSVKIQAEGTTKSGTTGAKAGIPVKRGRPRKYPVNEEGMVVLGNGKLRRITYKRKSDVYEEDEGEPPTKKQRCEQSGSGDVTQDADATIPPPAPRRGRPKKVKFDTAEPATKKRGRHAKNAKQSDPVDSVPDKPDPQGTDSEPWALRSRGRVSGSERKVSNDDLESEYEVPVATPTRRSTRAAAKRLRPTQVLPPPSPAEDLATQGPEPMSVDRGANIVSTEHPAGTEDPANADAINDNAAIYSEVASPSVAVIPPPPMIISGPDPMMDLIDPALRGMLNEAQPKVMPRDETPMQLVSSGDLSIANAASSSAPKHSGRGKVNVSHLRRENELYKIVADHGGIFNIQTKEIYDAHMALLEKLSRAGEPTSAPIGTRTDKRTIATTFDSLERRRKIKQLRTTITTHTGVQRPACIVYLPSITQERLNAFLAELSLSGGQQPQPSLPTDYVKIDEPVEYSADAASMSRSTQLLPAPQSSQPPGEPQHSERWGRNVARAEELFAYDDDKIREVLLGERTTLAQLYGFIVGRMARVRAVHLAVLDAFECAMPSPRIVSHEDRIVDASFLSIDLPLRVYCGFVSTLVYDQELHDYLNSPEGSQILVRDIPQRLQDVLQVGRARPRSRMLDNLELLKALKLVTPVEPPPSASNVVGDQASTSATASTTPSYWQFKRVAPVYLYGLPSSMPPFHTNMQIGTVEEATQFWKTIEQVSKSTQVPLGINVESIEGNSDINSSVLKTLRRDSSWSLDYALTWHQTQYLNQFANIQNVTTPQQLEDEGERQQRIDRLAWVISAPPEAVRRHYEGVRDEIKKESSRATTAAKRQKEERRERQAAETKASLARKAAEAKVEREREWEELVTRVHPEPPKGSVAVRIKRVRTRFLQAGTTKDKEKWENEIQSAIHEATMAAHKVLSLQRNIPNRNLVLAVPPPAVANPPEKSIQELIAEQGPALPTPVKRRKKSMGTEATPEATTKAQRRSRTFWSRDFEELARDASVIIRARCRGLPRLDWGALEQVFPAIPRNSVRQRLGHIRESPGNEAYLKRLEDKWYELWIHHRGMPLLPDDDPQSPTNFDLIKHIEFLRRHVDKNAIRVGFVQPREKSAVVIPASLEELHKEYTFTKARPSVPTWDFVWNATVEEGREKRMLIYPFLNKVDDPPPSNETLFGSTCIAESALKMVFGTPNDRYDAEAASLMLHNIGEEPIAAATKNLLSRGVISKVVRDPTKQKPGRQLKVSEANQNALGGTFSRDLFTDAVAVEEMYTQQEGWKQWPLVVSDGDIAALVELVSDHKVEFKIDTTQAQLARPSLDWNSKKADDDDIETALHVQYHSMPANQSVVDESPGRAVSVLSPSSAVSPAKHGEIEDGSDACCRGLTEEGLFDCAACLQQETASCLGASQGSERETIQQSLDALHQAGSGGLSKPKLKDIGLDVEREEIQSAIRQLIDRTVPLCFWAGHEEVVLISARYLKAWSVVVAEKPMIRVLPRRWVDITGHKVHEVWEAALRAVMGIIIFRPGITQGELRWRLRSVYDRQEVNDLLRHLQEEGHLKARSPHGHSLPLHIPSNEEERLVFWTVNSVRPWYQI